MKSIYYCNPSETYPSRIDLKDGEATRESIIHIVKNLCGHPWSIVEDELFTISYLSGGITNSLVLVSTKIDKVTQKVIVRIFGNGTEMIIDRAVENTVFASLSSQQVLIAPIFYGLFENGRVEGYIDNIKTLDPDDLCSGQFTFDIASTVAIFHTISVENISHDIFLWEKIENFFEIAKEVSFTDSKKREALHDLQLAQSISDYERFKAFITTNVTNETKCSFECLGREFGAEIVFCHNDLLSGNILYRSLADASIAFIDYEYCRYNYRAYDIANHFCEYCGFDFNIADKFPSQEKRRDFLAFYVQSALKVNDPSVVMESSLRSGLDIFKSDSESFQQFISGLDSIVCEFLAASHLFWGTWSILQAGVSKIDFDYLSYAKLRYDGYHYHKKLFKWNW